MSTTGRINPDYLSKENIGAEDDEVRNEFTKKDIATTSLLTRYSLGFTIVTSIFWILLLSLLGMILYLMIEIYKSFSDHNEAEQVISILVPSVLVCMMIIWGWYYFAVVREELVAADKIVTDIERRVTAPMTAASLKANLTNLVAIKTGKKDRDSVKEIYQNLNRQIGNSDNYNTPEKQQEYNRRMSREPYPRRY